MAAPELPSSQFTQSPTELGAQGCGEYEQEYDGNTLQTAPEAGFLPLPHDESPIKPTMEQQQGQMVTIYKAAEIAGVNPWTVRRIISKGQARSEKRFVPIETEMVFVSLEDVLANKQMPKNKGGRPRKNS